jgi:hypothetical protein
MPLRALLNDMSFSLDHCVRGRSRLGGGLPVVAPISNIGQVDAAQSLEFEGAGVGALPRVTLSTLA